jgi:DNA-binding beta-propeller fold protein YncE
MRNTPSGGKRRGMTACWLVVLMLGVAAGGLLLTGDISAPQITRASETATRRATGAPQLISMQALPSEADGPMCEWAPASAGQTLLAALQEARAAAPDALSKTIDRSGLKPLRAIKDPYAAYSSVAVDLKNNEVVMTDENLFQILVYDRNASTPPSATMTEPKRILAGENTKIEFQCGLYIDPETSDIYAVNNDTVDTLVIFGHEQRGDAKPQREIHTPHGTFGIAVDEGAQELFLTTQHDSTVTVFHKGAKGEESPIRILQGKDTGLADPHGLAIDTRNQLMFVSNHGSFHLKEEGGEAAVSYVGGMATTTADKALWPVGEQKPGSGKSLPPSITMYPLKAEGNTKPLRTIQGPKAQLDWPTGMAVDVERNELYVANDMGDSILVFDTNASGDVAPKRVLKGAKTMLKNPTGIWLDMKNNELWSANFGNHTATVFKIGASGDTAPLRVIRSGPLNQPSLGIGNPHPIAYDSKREEILVPN